MSWPESIEALPLPPYSPELNPVERLFEELRGKLSNMVFASVEAMLGTLTEALRPYWETPLALARLMGYGWWLEGILNMET